MKLTVKSALLMASVLILIAGCKTVSITKPDASVPAEYAAFSGTWEGTWGKNLYGQLAVQTITAEGQAKGWYSWGNMPGSFSGGGAPFTGAINNKGVLKLSTFSNGANVSYRLLDDNTLDGTYSLNGKDYFGQFIKQ